MCLALCHISIALSRGEILSVPETPEWLHGLENITTGFREWVESKFLAEPSPLDLKKKAITFKKTKD